MKPDQFPQPKIKDFIQEEDEPRNSLTIPHLFNSFDTEYFGDKSDELIRVAEVITTEYEKAITKVRETMKGGEDKLSVLVPFIEEWAMEVTKLAAEEFRNLSEKDLILLDDEGASTENYKRYLNPKFKTFYFARDIYAEVYHRLYRSLEMFFSKSSGEIDEDLEDLINYDHESF